MKQLLITSLFCFSILFTTAQATNGAPKEALINFKELTIGQFEKLTTLLAKTTYKDSAQISATTTVTRAQMEKIIEALGTLVYNDVVTIIATLYDSGSRQLNAAAKKEGKKE